MTPQAQAAIKKLLTLTSKLNGGANPTKVFNVAPAVVQKMEDHVKQSNEFLRQINNVGVKEVKGQILGFGVPGTVTKRTRSANPDGSKRRPTDPSALRARDYECHEVEQDSVITWDKIDHWAHLSDFYQRYRDSVTFAKARDRLLIGWHGQGVADDTDPDTHSRLQDVNEGWIQYMINENPSQVLGLNPDGSIKHIKVDQEAQDADFRSMDELVYHLRYGLLHPLYRERTSLRVLTGDELVLYENGALLAADAQTQVTERLVTKLYMNNQQLGQVQRAKSDEFPTRGIFLTPLDNISRYYQTDSVRRKISDNDHKYKGIVDYNFVREDYVLEAAEGCVCVHPDAIQLKDDNGAWKSASTQWQADLD